MQVLTQSLVRFHLSWLLTLKLPYSFAHIYKWIKFIWFFYTCKVKVYIILQWLQWVCLFLIVLAYRPLFYPIRIPYKQSMTYISIKLYSFFLKAYEWLQITLYIRVLVNVTKWMKKAPILCCTFLTNYFL